jgi:hypothetical protein
MQTRQEKGRRRACPFSLRWVMPGTLDVRGGTHMHSLIFLIAGLCKIPGDGIDIPVT